jgi:hypothetical protein
MGQGGAPIMPLYQRRRRLKIRFPEFLAALVLLFTAVPAGLWAYESHQADWQRATGYVQQVDFTRNSINVDRLPDLTDVRYLYTVGGASFTGHWNGAWPQAHSPDALPRTELERQLSAGRLLTVYFDPRHPEQSTLHVQGPGRIYVYQVLTGIAIVSALVFLLRAYPRLRQRL